MARKPIQIDRDKLRAEVRKLRSEYVFFMLDDAIELLPPAKLLKIAKKYFDLKRLRPDAERATRPSLLTDVKRFEKKSLAGEYYESFGVNSQNYTQQSAGTSSWIAEFRRLLDRCVANARPSYSSKAPSAATCYIREAQAASLPNLRPITPERAVQRAWRSHSL